MKIIFLLAILLLAFANADAQTVQVDINRAKLSWNWSPDVGGVAPTEFRMKCGTTAGTYTKITTIGAAVREMAVKDAISGAGNWFCVVVAANSFGESGGSNEIPFAAGAAPVGKISLLMLAQ